jgi:precorrin-3B synthase
VLDGAAEALGSALAQSGVCEGASDKLGVVLDSGYALADIAADIHVNIEPQSMERASIHVASRTTEWSYLGDYRTEDIARITVALIAALPPRARMRDLVAECGIESLRERARLAASQADDLTIQPHERAGIPGGAIVGPGSDAPHARAGLLDAAIGGGEADARRGSTGLTASHARIHRDQTGNPSSQPAFVQRHADGEVDRPMRVGRQERGFSRIGVSAGGASGPVWIELGLPFGSGDRATWEQLAHVASRYGSGEVRVTPFRTVLVPGIERERLAAALQLAEAAGWITAPDNPLLRVAACPGAPACSAANGNTRELASELAPLLAAGQSLHVSGCAKGCAQSGAASLTLVCRPGGCSLGFDLTAAQTADTARLTLAEARELTAIRSRIAGTNLLARDSSTLQARELR